MSRLAQRSRVNATEDPFGDGAEPTDDILLKRFVHYAPEVKIAPVPVVHDVPWPQPESRADSDDEYSEDYYDWSGEEDLDEEAAKFCHDANTEKDNRWTFKRILTVLFTSLVGSIIITGLFAIIGILLHLHWDDPSPEHLAKMNVEAWLFWTAANLLASWCLALFVDVLPIVVRYSIMAAWGHVSEEIKTCLGLYAGIKNTIKPVLYAASSWASWVIIFGHFYDLYNPKDGAASRSQYTRRVFQVIEFVFFCAVVLCAQNMFLHAIAFTFHQTTSVDRLNAVHEALPVIESLRNYQPRGSHISGPRHGHRAFTFLSKDKYQFDCDSDDGTLGDTEDSGISRRKLKGKRRSFSWVYGWFRSKSRQPTSSRTIFEAAESGTSSPLTYGGMTPSLPILHHGGGPSRHNSDDLIMDAGETIAQAARVLRSTVLHDARNIAGHGENEEGQETLGRGTGTVEEAKHLARSIYTKLQPPHSGRTFLIPADFYPIFATHEKAERAFRVFDKDDNGDISRGEVKSTLVKIYKERRLLARSMRDIDAALKVLHRILLVFAAIILFYISMGVFSASTLDGLKNLTILLGLVSFIFKSATSRAFDAIMFLFVTHPFDTGDRCFIDDENLVVKKMTLFATIFTRVDGTETYYFNSQLFSKFITNVRRSGNMFENCTLQIDWETPLEKLDELERYLNEWLSTEENRWFQPATSIVLQDVTNQRYLEITIGLGHNGTWQDWGLRCARKTAFHAAVQYYCRQLGIVGYEPARHVVYADTDTKTYIPSSPAPFSAEPISSIEKMKPSLGFLPPMEARRANLRKRKTKGRKAVLRSMDV